MISSKIQGAVRKCVRDAIVLAINVFNNHRLFPVVGTDPILLPAKVVISSLGKPTLGALAGPPANYQPGSNI